MSAPPFGTGRPIPVRRRERVPFAARNAGVRRPAAAEVGSPLVRPGEAPA